MDDCIIELGDNIFNSDNLSNDSLNQIKSIILNLNRKIEEMKKNEIILKEKYETIIDEINLKNSQKFYDLNEKIDLLQNQNNETIKELNFYKQGQEEVLSKRNKEILNNFQLLNQDLKSIKAEKVELKKSLEMSLKNVNDKLEEIASSAKQFNVDQRHSLSKEFDEMNEKIAKTNPANEGILVMPIDKISDIKKGKWNYVFSEYFTARMNPYLMRLKLTNCDNGLWIWLLIYPGESDDDLQWPFQAEIAIKVASRANPFQCKIMRKHCKIERPEINSSSTSEIFKFLHCDLIKSGLMKSICIVEGLVKFS